MPGGFTLNLPCAAYNTWVTARCLGRYPLKYTITIYDVQVCLVADSAWLQMIRHGVKLVTCYSIPV